MGVGEDTIMTKEIWAVQCSPRKSHSLVGDRYGRAERRESAPWQTVERAVHLPTGRLHGRGVSCPGDFLLLELS